MTTECCCDPPNNPHRSFASGPRNEVADHVISSLQVIIAEGGGVLGNTGWAVLMVERSGDGAVYDLSHRGVEVARCYLAITAADAERLWGQAVGSTLPGVRPAKPTSLPWLAAGLLPAGMVLLGDFPKLMVELDDLERCLAWAVIDLQSI